MNQASILREVSTIARRLVDHACEELCTLRESECTYAFEDQVDGESAYITMKFDRIPCSTGALLVMQLATVARSLTAAQQHLVAAIYLAEDELTLSEMHEQWARAGGRPDKATVHAMEAGLDRARASALRDRLSATTADWLLKHPTPLPPGSWTDYPMPVDVPVSAASLELEQIAGWYRELGLRLFQPMALDERAPPQTVDMWKRHWRRAEDCGDGLILLSGWLRCLVQTEDSRRCDVCYRHVDKSAGMRKYCSEHARTARKQKDQRQMGVSRLYQIVLRHRLRKAQDLDTLLSTDVWPKGDHGPMVKLARAECLPEALVEPAAALAYFLRALIPLLSATLARDLKAHFAEVIHRACLPFPSPGRNQLTFEARVAQRRAEDWLGWQAFFRTWFGQNSEKESQPAVKFGRGLDVHHPLLYGPGIRPSKIALDLVRYRIWTAIDEVFDRDAYNNRAEVVRLRDGGEPGRSDKGQLTFREIGRRTGMSAEAAQKTYDWAKDPNSPVRRNRIVPGRLRSLERRLIDELL